MIASAANPFGRYYAEILRCEGLNAFTVTDLSLVTPAVLTAHDVAAWRSAGPQLRAGDHAQQLGDERGRQSHRHAPRPELAALCGLSTPSGTLANAYMLIDTGTTPGAGLVAETIQFHGAADLSALDGASALATLYSTAIEATPSPAVSLRAVGGTAARSWRSPMIWPARSFTPDKGTRRGTARSGTGRLRAVPMISSLATPPAIRGRLDRPRQGRDPASRRAAAVSRADRPPRQSGPEAAAPLLVPAPRPRGRGGDDGRRACTGGNTVNRFNQYIDQSPAGCSSPTGSACARAPTSTLGTGHHRRPGARLSQRTGSRSACT